MRQAETEFLLWQGTSHYPFCQLITDLNSGGVAFYAQPPAHAQETMRVVYHVLPSLDTMWEFMAELVKSLDTSALTSLLRFDTPTTSTSAELEHPRRVKPKLKGDISSLSGSGLPSADRFWKILSAMQADEQDIACLQDVNSPDSWPHAPYPCATPYHS